MKVFNIAIDATLLLFPKTGIGHYTDKLIQTLRSSNYPVELNLFYGWKWSRNVKRDPDPRAAIAAKHIKRFVPNAYSVASFVKQRAFNFGVRKFKPDIFHGTNFIAPSFRGPTVITVHDLSYLRYPETLPPDRLDWMRKKFPMSINKAAKVFTISNFVKKEILKYFSIPEEKIVVTRPGVDSLYRVLNDRDLRLQLGQFKLKPYKYILSVSTIEPRKNLLTLIQAYSKLPTKTRESYPLVLVGLRGWKESSLIKSIESLKKNGQVRILGYVPQKVLPALYSGARVFAYPSFYEGFGMPVTESMACGTPVIASDSSSIPEVLGKSGILLDPYDINVWRESLAEIIENDEKYNFLKVKGLERASLFSWEKTTETIFQVYSQVISSKI